MTQDILYYYVSVVREYFERWGGLRFYQFVSSEGYEALCPATFFLLYYYVSVVREYFERWGGLRFYQFVSSEGYEALCPATFFLGPLSPLWFVLNLQHLNSASDGGGGLGLGLGLRQRTISPTPLPRRSVTDFMATPKDFSYWVKPSHFNPLYASCCIWWRI